MSGTRRGRFSPSSPSRTLIARGRRSWANSPGNRTSITRAPAAGLPLEIGARLCPLYRVLAQNEHSVAGHWRGDFEESALRGWVEALRSRLSAPRVSLGLVFLSPRMFSHAEQILEILRVHGQIPCSRAVLARLNRHAEEIEHDTGLALGLYSLPGAELKGFHFGQGQVEEANGPGYWQMETGVDAEQSNGWLVFADPVPSRRGEAGFVPGTRPTPAAGVWRPGRGRPGGATGAGLFERRGL